MIRSDTPIWQLTVSEFMQVLENCMSKNDTRKEEHTAKKYVYGLKGLCELFSCSKGTAIKIKESGVIDKAVTQIGRKIIVDAELALELHHRKKK